MNAAGRLVHQNLLTRHLVITHILPKRQIALAVLAFAIIMSALSIIYVTHSTRVLHANYHRDLVEGDRLHVERGQLLLERSTWMMPARIQKIAENKLRMVLPNHKSVVIIHE